MRGYAIKIRALEDCDLKTYYTTHFLVQGEVKLVRFKNRETLNELLKFKHFVLACHDEEETRPIPVLLPEADEENIFAVEDGEVFLSEEESEESEEPEESEEEPEEEEIILEQKGQVFPSIELLTDIEDIEEVENGNEV